jgi:hypothetical protein
MSWRCIRPTGMTAFSSCAWASVASIDASRNTRNGVPLIGPRRVSLRICKYKSIHLLNIFRVISLNWSWVVCHWDNSLFFFGIFEIDSLTRGFSCSFTLLSSWILARTVRSSSRGRCIFRCLCVFRGALVGGRTCSVFGLLFLGDGNGVCDL